MLLVPDSPPVLPLIAGDGRRAGWRRLALFVAWLTLAGWLAAHHVMWRDEVRAFTLALSEDGVPAMLRRIHGEGHPALWYLLLRAAHGVTGVREALPGTAFAIGAAAAVLFAWRAPFRPLVIALVLFGAYTLNEYTVIARNYGVSMLLLFAVAWYWPRGKERGFGIGVLLALLCNTNVPSVLLAGALGLFWGVELWCRDGLRRTPAWRHYALNMAVALLGVIACVAEVYPPYNDAAMSPMAGHLSIAGVLMAAVNVTAPFSALVPEAWWGIPIATVLLAAMVVGSPLGLIRSPGGLVAAVSVMVAFPLFFQLVYPGGYRHQALYIAFLLTLYWLVATGHGGRWPARAPALRPATQALLQRFGHGALLALLATQVVISIYLVTATAGGLVYSRSRDLAALLERDGLERAVVIASPDVLLEPLPYYAANPIWLVREHKWGQVAAFTKKAEADLKLADITATARALAARRHRPVVIVMQLPLDPAAPKRVWDQGYLGTLATTPAEVRDFLGSTRRLARLGPAETDESYDVYLLTRS